MSSWKGNVGVKDVHVLEAIDDTFIGGLKVVPVYLSQQWLKDSVFTLLAFSQKNPFANL